MRSTAQIYDIGVNTELQSVKGIPRLSSRLVIANVDGSHIIPFGEIRRCVSEGNYCKVLLENGREIIASKTLKYVEAKLPKSLFIRTHQSHLVNRDDVRFLGNDFLIMSDDSKIPISRGRKSYVSSFFKS